MLSFICKICNKDIKNESFGRHLSYADHKIDGKRLGVSDYFNNCFPEQREEYDEYLKAKQKTNSPNTLNFYLFRGYTQEEAEIALEKHRASKPFRLRKDFRPNQIGYWVKKGFSEDEAVDKVKTFQSRSLENYIKTYGEDIGVNKYNSFLRSLDIRKDTEIQNIMLSNNVLYDDAEEIFKNKRIEASPRRIEYWIKKGFTEESAKEFVSQWQKMMSPRCIDYWNALGYSEEIAKKKIKEYQDNNSLNAIMKRLNCTLIDAFEYQENIYNKTYETNLKNGKVIDRNLKATKEKYYYDVWKETEKNYTLYYNEINPSQIKRSHPKFSNKYDSYALDHKYSIFEGFKNNIDPKLIGFKGNLRIISFSENSKKRQNCSITLEELRNMYNHFNRGK